MSRLGQLGLCAALLIPLLCLIPVSVASALCLETCIADETRLERAGAYNEFELLRADISSYTPIQFQGSMVTMTSSAQQAYPSDPCRSFSLLHSIDSQVSGLTEDGYLSLAVGAGMHSDILAIITRGHRCSST